MPDREWDRHLPAHYNTSGGDVSTASTGPGQREVVSVGPEEQRRHESWRAV